MLEKNKDWENYLLSPSGVSSDAIGVVDLDKKLDAIERNDPEYQAMLKEAIDDKEPVKGISREDIIDWLLSLGD